MSDKFLIIDGSSLLHRAFFALPPLMTKKGVHTGAVYGFCNMLLRLLTELSPKYVAIAFDKSRKTFRSEKYEEYKAQRKPTPGELSEQFPLAMKLLQEMGIRTMDLEGYEADDIIGTLSSSAPKELEVIVVTGDKDEFQLIDDNVKIYYTKRGISDIQIYDAEEFAKNYEGLAPLQIIDLKGLMGDVSDNIPGVPGVGPKTALKLIVEYSSVENVLENIDNVKGKSLKEKLTANKEQALLSKNLATICLCAPVSTDLAEYTLQGLSKEVKVIMHELEFRNLWERFTVVLGSDEEASAMDLFGSETYSQVEHYPRVKVLSQAQAVGIIEEIKEANTITPITYVTEGNIPHISLATLELLVKETVYVVEKDSNAWPAIYAWLADGSATKAVCDGKELYKACFSKEQDLKGIVEDISLAGYLYEAGENSFTLKSLCDRYLLPNDGGTVQDLGALVPIVQKLLTERELCSLYKTIELPLVEVLAKMEFAGIAVDEKMLKAITKEIKDKVDALEILAQEQAGEEFNVKSPKQLGVLLFEKLQLPIIKKTKTGYSTDVTVLAQLEGKHPIISTILEHRKLAKLLSTYLEGMEPLINSDTRRIHTHFQQAVTITGRLSSTEPNLQNIPTRTDIGKRMREMFVPGEGYDLLMSCDYSQVELRILAHISQDPLLVDSFAKGQDVHARTAAEVFGVPIDEVTSFMRNKAKAVNFGIVYGISDYGLSRQLNVSRDEAGLYIENYFARYTGVKTYMDSEIAKARDKGYVETLFGRRRYLPEIKHSNFNLRSSAERTAINTPIQGTAADIIKIAMLKVAEVLKQEQLKSRVLLQVHDELLLEVIAEEKDKVAALVKKAMETAVTFSVPLVVDVAVGKTWAQTK